MDVSEIDSIILNRIEEILSKLDTKLKDKFMSIFNIHINEFLTYDYNDYLNKEHSENKFIYVPIDIRY